MYVKRLAFGHVPLLHLIGLASTTGTLYSPLWDPRDIYHRNAVPLHLRWSHLNGYKTPKGNGNSQLPKTIFQSFFGWPLQQKSHEKKTCAPWRQFAFCCAWNHLFFWFTAKLPMFFFFRIHFYEILHNVAVNLWEFCFWFAFFVSGGELVGSKNV